MTLYTFKQCSWFEFFDSGYFALLVHFSKCTFSLMSFWIPIVKDVLTICERFICFFYLKSKLWVLLFLQVKCSFIQNENLYFQTLLHILKDVSKTPSWKPGCLATSITSKPQDEDSGSRVKGIMGNVPVQHDVVMEEASRHTGCSSIWNSLFSNEGGMITVTKEHTR